MWKLLLCLIVSSVSLGCAGSRTGFYEEEEPLTARGGLGENGVFHDVVYNPTAITLNFPGYIVGLDKARHHAINEGARYPAFDTSQDTSGKHGLRDVKFRMSMDPKAHYVSHVVKNHGKSFGQGNCVLYTIFTGWGLESNPREEMKYRDAGETPSVPCSEASKGRGKTALRDSFDAIRSFEEDLRQELESKKTGEAYSHIVVISMGWNTPQLEAIQNFNALGTHLKAASGSAHYRPLVIGITWPSVWSFQWLDPAIKLASYTAKAHDADEVGTIWISEIIDAVKAVAPSHTKLIAMGHSFGARAMFSAVCGESVWASRPQGRKIDVLFGWQAAFSVRRLTRDGAGDGFAYEQGCLDRAETIVLTSSIHDEAVDSAVWADMAGGHDQWTAVCSSGKIKLSHTPVKTKPACLNAEQVKSGTVEALAIRRRTINYVDASNIVIYNQPNTGGGAHSDIYRAVHGRLAWRALVAQD
jgi:hypothetical protein